MLVEVGSILEGKVTGITNFGAFVQLPDGTTGLVHISEVAEEYVQEIKSYLSENQMVKVKVISIENGKISLSIKKAKASDGHRSSTRPVDVDWKSEHSEKRLSFEEQLAKYMKDSEEKMHDLKKKFDDNKRGNRKSAH